jgi:hypothetical protein
MRRAVLPDHPAHAALGLAALFGLWLFAAAPALAQGEARCTAVQGVLLARDGGAWKAIKNGDAVPADTTLVALFEANFVSANGAVEVKLVSDIGEFGPLPALESAVLVHKRDDADLALTLDRGIIILTNQKKSSAAKTRLTIRGEMVTVTQKTPGAKLAIEVYGRHPGGIGAILKDEPTTFLIALVKEGQVELASRTKRFVMSAPPGPAVLHWDSLTKEAELVTLDKFPPELMPTEKIKAEHAAICKAAAGLEQDRDQALKQMLASSNPHVRRAAVTTLGALDDVPQLIAALSNEKHQDVREQAILALRHWLGRSSGQVKMLQVELMKSGAFTLPQIKTTMSLLFGFDDGDRDHSAAKQLVLVLLDHDKVAIRELAHWQLVRMAPKGREFGYDAAAQIEERQRAVARWRQLLAVDSADAVEKK